MIGTEQRALLRRWPSGVSVVVAEAGGRRAGLTVSSLISLSLDPPLVGISLAHKASLYDVFREAESWAVSILSGEQEAIARRFAASLPADVVWDGIAVRDDDPRLLADAAGWLRARTIGELAAGDHTFFAGEVTAVENGPAASSLVYFRRGYQGL
jgi:flavin reductase (DIM6/NTAB) family NADH-FMN oxidoreductase RutF